MTIICQTCGALAESTEERNGMPVPPEGWMPLLAFKGWEFECPKCWANIVKQDEEAKSRAA